jgi:hypothetical protein
MQSALTFFTPSIASVVLCLDLVRERIEIRHGMPRAGQIGYQKQSTYWRCTSSSLLLPSMPLLNLHGRDVAHRRLGAGPAEPSHQLVQAVAQASHEVAQV